MSSLVLVGAALLALVIGYRYYSPLVGRWLGEDLTMITPAEEMKDGVDYMPARHWTVLFGHHFASIAGAAPIIGPVIACLFWGWLPAVLWLVLGGIFMGAVHDYSSLVISVQNKGVSIASITEDVLGKSGKIVFSLFVFLALILVVAVFAAVAGKTLATTPEVVLPTFGLVLVAMFIGFLMYQVRLNLLISSVIGVALLFGLIYVGKVYLPISLPVENPAQWWTVILLIYGLVAAVTPVTILLQPRDHLAGSVLFVGMLLGFAGLLVTRPEIKAPPFIAFSAAKGALWPMLFVTIACGAISGFHSMVGSGTTSKQLPRMKDARRIAFGGMLMESALSILAVVAVTAGLYWKTAPFDGAPVYQTVFAEGGYIKAFGTGYGEITKVLLPGFGTLVGITMLKTFVMTTLDSATRITRYIATELLGDTFGIAPLKNKYLATLLVGILSGALALGNWKAIWPVFGASNQLIASLVLIVVSAYLLARGRRYFFVAIPAVLMLITTLAALVFQTWGFFTASQPKIMLGSVSFLLGVMAIYLVLKAFLVIRSSGRHDESASASEA